MKIVEFYVRTYSIDKIAKALLKQNIDNFFIDEIKHYNLINKSLAFLPRFRVFFSVQSEKNEDIIKKLQSALAKKGKYLHKSEITIYITELIKEIDI